MVKTRFLKGFRRLLSLRKAVPCPTLPCPTLPCIFKEVHFDLRLGGGGFSRLSVFGNYGW